MNIRKSTWLLFVYSLLSCLVPHFGQAGDAGKALQTITVVSDDNYPPYIFRSSNGDIQGILVDQWKLWEEKTGIKVSLIAMDWNKAQEFLLNGKADVIDTLFFTEERAKQYDFTNPYATIEVPVFFHKNLGGIAKIASLEGFTIGVKAGDACIEVLKKGGITNLREFNSYEAVIQAAADGRIKVFSIDKPPAFYYLYKMNIENEFRYSFNLYTGEFHRAVKKGRTDILKVVDDGFALINSREHDAIDKKWMGEPFVRPAYLRYVLFFFLIAGLIFLVLIFFNITLRKKIRSKTSELQDLVNQLRLSEDRFKSMFDQAAVGVALCDSRSGNFLNVNQRYCNIVGYSQKDISQLSFQDITHPDDLQDDLNFMKLLLEGKINDFTLEKRYFHKNGSIVWVKITVSPMWKHGDDANFHIAIVEDITEHKKIEEAARESEAKYRELVGSLPEVVFEMDATGTLTFVNQNAFDLFGYTEEELDKGLNALQMIIPEDRNRALKNIQKILNGYILGGLEYTALRKNGTTFPVEIHSNCSMRDTQPIGLRGLIIDLSKSKKMETDLKRRAMAMDQSSETIVITDTNGLITYVNPAFEKTSGYSQEEALGKNPRILQGGKHDAMFYRELWHTISTGKTWCGIFINKRKDGAQYIEEATISPVLSDKGEIVNYVAVKRDISDKLKLETQLQQAQKMEAIGNLAGGVAHDFNNILTPIVGYTEMLLLDAHDNSPVQMGLSRILAAAKTAKNLVNQILTFSRQSEHEKKPLKVQLVIKEALKLVRSSLPATVDIENAIDSDCGPVLADETQIHQIIMNLCTNAYHAMTETGGKVTVTLKEVELAVDDLKDPAMIPGKYVCLTVADTGIGMNQGTMGRIFEPYFTTKETGKGTGLGLAVVHGIVKDHSGHVTVYSEPGKGTEFNVYLPVIKAIQDADQFEMKPIQKGDEHILLVDDKKDVVDIEQQMLEYLGYHVTARTSSPDALEAFRANPDKFDLVITDMTMPNMTGDKLAGELIKIRSGMPVILCTGFSEMMSKEKAESTGIKGFLMKPVVIGDLSAMIRKVLDNG
ncbi:MAG: PAS domain S-box protein [Pseudomonadota bacterium]